MNNFLFFKKSLFLIFFLFSNDFLLAGICDILTIPEHMPGYDEFCDDLYKPISYNDYLIHSEHRVYLAGIINDNKSGIISRIKEIGEDHPSLGYLNQIISIAAAWGVHITTHEMGHHIAAQNFGAKESEIHFFYKNPENGKFYFGYNKSLDLPQESRGSVAAAGVAAEQWLYNFAIELERAHPSTFGKALMFFSTANFVGYTLYANYVSTDDPNLDPTAIRNATGLSKSLFNTIVFSKAALNTYKAFNPDFPMIPEIFIEKKSFGLQFHIPF